MSCGRANCMSQLMKWWSARGAVVAVGAIAVIGVSLRSTPAAERAGGAGGYSKLVFPGPDGKLQYKPSDEQGDTIPDFSNCGYKGGGVALPDAKVAVTLEPQQGAKDDNHRIQQAIDQVSKMPLDDRGLRGAVLLKRGTYRIPGQLKIFASGVVLRGEGDGEGGTLLIAAGKKQRDLIQERFMAGDWRLGVRGDQQLLMTSGSELFRVDISR